jgi:hypothetical protein
MQAELDLETADKLVVDDEKMLEAEEEEGMAAYIAPTAYQPFDWAAQRAQAKLNKALLDDVPEFNQELIRQYIRHCQHEIEKLTPPAPAPMPVNDMAGGAPPGAAAPRMPGGGVNPVPATPALAA